MEATNGSTLDGDSIAAVLFDLDGTLMNSDDQAVERLALRLQRLGWSYPHRNARWLVMAAETPLNMLITLLDALGLDAPVLGLWARSRGLRRGTMQPDYLLMEGAGAMLVALRRRFRLVVVTTRGRSDAEAFLEQHGLVDLFEAVVTRESTTRLKPHPAPIRQAAKELGVPVEQCVMVGDTTMDVRSARRAGAIAVAVLCGFGNRRELERAGAYVVLDHVAGLGAVL